MSDHLPECTLPKGHGDCICGELREAEQRGYETGCIHSAAKYPYIYSDGVKAARDAVAAMKAEPAGPMATNWDYYDCGMEDALAAIDGVTTRGEGGA